MTHSIANRALLLVAAALLVAPGCHAQSPTTTPVAEQAKPKAVESISYFHLVFVVTITDNGKVTSNRTYAMDANTTSNFRASYRSDTTERAPEKSNFRDVLNIDCSQLHPVGSNAISMVVNTVFDSGFQGTVSPTTTTNDSNDMGELFSVVVLGKPTLVFSSDGPVPNRRVEMTVTATPIRIN